MKTKENPAGNHPSSRVLLCNTVSLYLMAYNPMMEWRKNLDFGADVFSD